MDNIEEESDFSIEPADAGDIMKKIEMYEKAAEREMQMHKYV